MPAERTSDLDRQIMEDPRHPASSALKRVAELEAELQAAQERADCGGVNCGKCQQCLTVNQWALQQSLQAAQEQLRRTEDELAEAAAHIGLARLAAQRTEEPSNAR